ncbi:hypothetical protein, partial [Saccharothrix syringae]|uniref:hypothetical protein n=1 Tax=Saccharothrix syringae TaxID=103733 RepID=UPI0012FB5E19
MAELLVDDLYVRTAAGSSPATPFMLSALDGPTIDVIGFAKGMAPGGYSREFYQPVGRLLFTRHGQITLSGNGLQQVPPIPPGGDDVQVLPLVDPKTGQVYGQAYPYTDEDPRVMVTYSRLEASRAAGHYFTEVVTDDGRRVLRAIRKPWPAGTWQFRLHGAPSGFVVRMRTRLPARGGDALLVSGEQAAKLFRGASVLRAARPEPSGPFLIMSCSVDRQGGGGDTQAYRLWRQWAVDHEVDAAFYAANFNVYTRPDGTNAVEDEGRFHRVQEPGMLHDPVERQPQLDVPAPLELRNVVSVTLADESGNPVGVGFLAGGEAEVVRSAFTAGVAGRVPGAAADARRFFVAVHHDEHGFRVPLTTGRTAVLDDVAFLKLSLTAGLHRDATLTLLSCSVADGEALRAAAGVVGFRGGVVSFPQRVELTASGGFRLLEVGETAPGTSDAVVLDGDRKVAVFAPVAGRDAGWGDLPRRMPAHGGGAEAVYAFVDLGEQGFLVEGVWYDGARFAAEAAVAPAFRDSEPTAPVVLVVAPAAVGQRRLQHAREFARALRGDGPPREVLVNTRPIMVDPATGFVDTQDAGFEVVSSPVDDTVPVPGGTPGARSGGAIRSARRGGQAGHDRRRTGSQAPVPGEFARTDRAAGGVWFRRLHSDDSLWRAHYGTVPFRDASPAPYYVYVHGTPDGAFLVDGERVGGRGLAGRLRALPGFKRVPFAVPVLLVVDRAAEVSVSALLDGPTGVEDPEAHLAEAREFAEALRDDARPRLVVTNSRAGLSGSDYEVVSEVMPHDLASLTPRDVEGRASVLAFPAQHEYAVRLVQYATGSTVYDLRVVAQDQGAENAVWAPAPWVDSAGEGRTPPLRLFLHSRGGRFTAWTAGGWRVRLGAEVTSPLVVATADLLRRSGGVVRAPLVLYTEDPVGDRELNRRFLSSLRELEGARQTFDYSGPLSFKGGPMFFPTHTGEFTSGPPLAAGDLVRVVREDVVGFPVDDAGARAIAEFAALVGGGGVVVGPWGGVRPLFVVVVAGGGGFARVLGVGGFSLELSGGELLEHVVSDGRVSGVLAADPGRP